MTRRQQFAEIIPTLVCGNDSISLTDLYAAIEQDHPDLTDEEVEQDTGAVRWKHEFRWELETLVVTGRVRRRKDIGKGIYST